MHHLRALRVLGLAPGAPPEEIRMAWRDLAKVWHPDRFAHDIRLQKKAGENLQRINAAYDTLKDYDPATKPPVAARMRESVAMVFGIGDLGELPPSSAPPRPTPVAPGVLEPSGPVNPRDSVHVLAVGGHHRYSTRFKEIPERKRRRALLAAAALLLIAVAAAWLLLR